MTIQVNSNLVAFFPLLVNGKAPPASDVFSVVASDATKFTATMGTMPSGPDQGNPAVVVLPLTLAGATGLSFTVTDNAGDSAATETFDIIPPAVVPGQISVDDPNVVFQTNPNPPTA